MQEGFRIRIDASGLIGGAHEPSDGFVYEIRSCVVVSEGAGRLIEPIREELLHRNRRSEMQLASFAGEQAVVRNILCQRMLEHVSRLILIPRSPFVQEFEATKFEEIGIELGGTGPDTLQK